MLSFDSTFDNTFQDDYPDGPPAQSGCRKEGVYLTWLTLQGGWQYWLFEGSTQTSQTVTIKGEILQGRLNRPTQKDTARSIVIHTQNLTQSEIDLVGTIRESVSVFWLVHKDDNTIVRVPVALPTGEAELWDDQRYTNNFFTTITLPYKRSQRL